MISEGKVTSVEPKDRAPGASLSTAVYGPAGCYSCGAHSVRVDAEGNIWVVDAGGHVVYKMNVEGRVIMQLGAKGESGVDSTHFHLPTDVAFAPSGDIYVSDGYAARAWSNTRRTGNTYCSGAREERVRESSSCRTTWSSMPRGGFT